MQIDKAEVRIVPPEQAQELIRKWNELCQLVDQYLWQEMESQAVIYEMLPILAALRDAGYMMTDQGYWFHLSEVN
jgi:hypothetical protein